MFIEAGRGSVGRDGKKNGRKMRPLWWWWCGSCSRSLGIFLRPLDLGLPFHVVKLRTDRATLRLNATPQESSSHRKLPSIQPGRAVLAEVRGGGQAMPHTGPGSPKGLRWRGSVHADRQDFIFTSSLAACGGSLRLGLRPRCWPSRFVLGPCVRPFISHKHLILHRVNIPCGSRSFPPRIAHKLICAVLGGNVLRLTGGGGLLASGGFH
jgi:hypothetical protein